MPSPEEYAKEQGWPPYDKAKLEGRSNEECSYHTLYTDTIPWTLRLYSINGVVDHPITPNEAHNLLDTLYEALKPYRCLP